MSIQDNSPKTMENRDTDPLIILLDKQRNSLDLNTSKNLPEITLIKINNSTTNNENDDANSSLNGSNNTIMCRICHCEEISEEFLITPCFCTGTLRYVHQSCLQQWLKSTGK